MSKVNFQRRKASVIPELRPLYKISKILLILNCCCIGKKSSLLKLHLFNWAMLDMKRLDMLNISAIQGDLIIGIWGIDPSLNMAIEFAISESLVEKLSNGAYKLSKKGEDFLCQSDSKALFEDEYPKLLQIGSKITEKMVNAAAKRWCNEV
ncbi:hypothetical protein NAT02_09435 [Aeromonas hydrophila]|uniref:hypothetical protein n=1 Tax=Aeromonas hydrophila TaxID=644 RepID=UPI001A2CE667|nr:hypothetical protein [Aeromonas hydrophila]MCP3243097.1 hypothetical protein [Aeromonas hydrophila]HAU4896306.1 hypothetical protein [Aeromonas hydrophila]